MLTVGEKRRVLEIMALGLAAEIDFDFPSVAADEKPPALMLRGLRDDERAKHGCELLGILVGLEMPALAVEQ